MFIVNRERTVKRKVIICEPADYGKEHKHELDVTFRLLPVDDFRALCERAEERDENGQVVKVDNEMIFSNTITDIRGLYAPDKTPLTYSVDLLPDLLKLYYVQGPLSDELLDVQLGQKKVLAKNS